MTREELLNVKGGYSFAGYLVKCLFNIVMRYIRL